LQAATKSPRLSPRPDMQYYLPNPLYALPTIEVQAHQHDPSRSWNAHTPLPISQRRTHIIETITAVEEPYTRKTKYAGGSEHTGEISFNRIGRVSGNRNEYNEKIPGSPSPQIGGTNSNTGRDYGGIYCQIPKCDRNQTFNRTAKAFSKAGNLKWVIYLTVQYLS
jgi:hypothetical protein